MKNIIVFLIVFVSMSFQSFSRDVIVSKKERKGQNEKLTKQHKQTNNNSNKILNWLTVIGKPMDSEEVKLLTKNLGTPNELNDIDKFTQGYFKLIIKPYRSEGLRLGFNKNNKKTLKTVDFFPKNEYYQECKTYLPMGFKFTDSPRDLKAKYKNSIQVGKTYSIFVSQKKYPNLIFKVFYKENKITQISFTKLSDSDKNKLLKKRTLKKVKTKTKTEDNSLCGCYNKIYNNYQNNYLNLTSKKRNNNSLGQEWDANFAIPAVFSDYTIETKYGKFQLESYRGLDLKKANTAIVQLYNNWYACRFNSGKEFQFIKEVEDLNNKDHTSKKRIFYLTTKTDNLLIKFNLGGSYSHNKNTNKFEELFEVSVSFINIDKGDKQKVINKILNN
ncbi:hypothetical protein [Polaribacter sp.]|uniref:hypothetical protein n=1 Tax=Polaribacter sp. TaxID=1920175 RepID=UPI003EF5F8B3